VVRALTDELRVVGCGLVERGMTGGVAGGGCADLLSCARVSGISLGGGAATAAAD
jgi:hypothetical protein